jgi:hypothetical protein
MIEAVAMKMTTLRKAIRNNRVSFPSQVPMFVRNAPGNIQRYSVQLYFLHGWNCGRIARRYGYSRFYIWQLVNEWKRHAVSQGYLQAIPPASVLLDLKNALRRTLDRAASLEQQTFKAGKDVSWGIPGAVADAQLARPLVASIRKVPATLHTAQH